MGPRTSDPWAAALHVTNGDSTVPELRATQLAHHIVCWRDALHEGPVPDVPADELDASGALPGRRARGGSRYHGGGAERDRVLESHRDGDYVLWFEADLYDQLQLIQIVARLHELDVPASRITLICIGEYPGIAHFGGLGELDSPSARPSIGDGRDATDDDRVEHATRAWKLFRAPDPGGLGEMAADTQRALRFVAEAFDRLSREYPSTRDGLSLTERRILAAVAAGAPTAAAAFVRVGARETRPFLGDTWCFDAMTRLARALNPLLEAEPAADPVEPHSRLPPHRRRPGRPRRPRGPRRAERHRPLDRRRAPPGSRAAVALERGHGDDHVQQRLTSCCLGGSVRRTRRALSGS